MKLNFFQSLLIGFVSGLTQILPVSADAHRSILLTLNGIESDDALFRLMLHIACLIAVYSFFGSDFRNLRRTGQQMRVPAKRRRKPLDPAQANTFRLLRSASLAVLIVRFLTFPLQFMHGRLELLPIGLILTGILLLIPALVRNGNMDSRNMPRLNGVLMGCGIGLEFIPGFSGIGCAMSLGQWQSVDCQFAFRFSGYLMVPFLSCQIISDLLAIIGGGAAVFSGAGFLFAISAAVAAGLGCRLGLEILNKTVKFIGLSGFSYYCWGAALLSIVLFLYI